MPWFICSYNTWTHQWTAVAQMNTQRAWPGVAILDNSIYIIGGFDGINRLRSVEVYNPDQDTWAFISGMNICRAGCSAAVLWHRAILVLIFFAQWSMWTVRAGSFQYWWRHKLAVCNRHSVGTLAVWLMSYMKDRVAAVCMQLSACICFKMYHVRNVAFPVGTQPTTDCKDVYWLPVLLDFWMV